jgi:hypothetical protein
VGVFAPARVTHQQQQPGFFFSVSKTLFAPARVALKQQQSVFFSQHFFILIFWFQILKTHGSDSEEKQTHSIYQKHILSLENTFYL